MSAGAAAQEFPVPPELLALRSAAAVRDAAHRPSIGSRPGARRISRFDDATARRVGRVRRRGHARVLSRSRHSASQPVAAFFGRRLRSLGRLAARRRRARARARGHRPDLRQCAARCGCGCRMALSRRRDRHDVRALGGTRGRELRHVRRRIFFLQSGAAAPGRRAALTAARRWRRLPQHFRPPTAIRSSACRTALLCSAVSARRLRRGTICSARSDGPAL